MAKKKPKVNRVTQADILRLGPDVARMKASMSPASWKAFVKRTHKRGFTVRSALQNVPDALRERTTSSLKDEAQRTIAEAYKPVERELSIRESTLNHLAEKRRNDDASYRQWLEGEFGKLEAQARAADESLATQQKSIADDVEANTKAAVADSAKRMQGAAGNVSDPNQSTALQAVKDAGQASRDRVASDRTLSTTMTGSGENARQMARSALLAGFNAEKTARESEITAARNTLNADRLKTLGERAAAAADLTSRLIERNVSIAQSNREADLAAASLGLKERQMESEIKAADRAYRLERDKFNLDKWIADNKAEAERAKIQLGYDRIKSQEGRAAADRKLREWVERYRAKQKREGAKDKKAGIDKEERNLYRDVQSARGLIERWHKNGRVAPNEIRQTLRDQYSFDDTIIDIAEDLRQHQGKLSRAGRVKARRLGIKHVGYFWDPFEDNYPAGPGHA